jgi:divalent metal cation (Fe/Co/Zn/Cd) transporter
MAGVEGDVWHNRADTITSIAAFVGISIALIGGPVYETSDDRTGLVTTFVILWNCLRLRNQFDQQNRGGN